MSRYDSLEREVDMLLAKLRKQAQQERAEEEQAAVHALTKEQHERLALASIERLCASTGSVDVAAVRQKLATECPEDSPEFTRRLHDELRRLHIEYRRAHLIEDDLRAQSSAATPPVEHEPGADAPTEPPTRPMHKSDNAPPGQAPAAVARAQAGEPAVPNDRDRVWIAEGQAAAREARRVFNPYASFPFDE